MDAVHEGPHVSASRLYELLSAEDLQGLPPTRWIVKGVMPEKGLAAIYGPAASGKSFLAISLAAAVGSGRSWFGQDCTAGRVVYIALEGRHGFRQRISAHEKGEGQPFPEAVFFIIEEFSLTSETDVACLVRSIIEANPCLVIIDTLNRAAPGADENSPEGMGRVLSAVARIQRDADTAVLLVHHTGKDVSRGMRGHSSLVAATDSVIEVERRESQRGWRIAKQKDGSEELRAGFVLEVVEIDAEEGTTSCVVRPTEVLPAPLGGSSAPKGGNQRVALDTIKELLLESEECGGEDVPPDTSWIPLAAALSAIGARLPVEPRRRAERARAAIEGLVKAGLIEYGYEKIWLPD